MPPVPDVEFVVTSPLCLQHVDTSATEENSLQSLLKPTGTREEEYAFTPVEDMLLKPPSGDDYTPPEGDDLYGEACTDDTDSVFREGDSVDLEFYLVGREPACHGIGLYPWDWESSCGAYEDASPSPSQPIEIEIIDGVSGSKNSTTYHSPWNYTMNVNVINPFAPFSSQLNLEFSRPFDGAVIQT